MQFTLRAALMFSLALTSKFEYPGASNSRDDDREEMASPSSMCTSSDSMVSNYCMNSKARSLPVFSPATSIDPQMTLQHPSHGLPWRMGSYASFAW